VVAADDADALVLVVRDLLARQSVDVKDSRATTIDARAIVDRPATFSPALARVWIDSSGEHATLWIADEAWDRILVRRVKRDPAHAEVAREEIGHIIETAIEAMLAGARIGLERAQLLPETPVEKPIEKPMVSKPRAEPKPEPEPEPHAVVRLRASFFERMIVFSSAVPIAHATGLGIGVESTNGLHPAGWLTASYRWPSWAHSELAGVKVQAIEARVLGRLTFFSRNDWRIDAALGAGPDITLVSPIAERSFVLLTRPSNDVSIIIQAVLTARWRALALSATVEVDTLLRDYPFIENGAQVSVLAPFRVRPGLMIEATSP
jgi:hypothetical protein